MPIKVQCACGAAFAAKEELAGRTVKCPKCQQPLKIPTAGPVVASTPAAPHASAPLGQPSHAAQAARPLTAPLPSQAAAAGHVHSHFDDVGLTAQQVGTVPCPGCTAPMPAAAVVCIKCGYNKKLGRRMETVKATSAAPLPGGHTVTAEELLHKAARTLEEEKEEERKKTREGMPWWVYLIGIIGCIGFMITMMLLPPQVALMTGGVLIWGVALLVNMYAIIRIVIVGFSESVPQGIMVLISVFICGLYTLYFVIKNWDQCGGYFIMALVSNFVASLVQTILVVSLGSLEDEEAYVPPPRPPVVETAGIAFYPTPLRKAEFSAQPLRTHLA
jgi:hypothetical protein